jgi:AcrR family transcriptional regulator
MGNVSDRDGELQLPLSRERILRTALALADAGDIEAISMRKIALALGVQAMSLYNHVANKDDILDGIVDLVIGEIEVPDLTVDWKEAMRRRSISAHKVLLRHPWAAIVIMARVNVGPASLRYIDATIGCLVNAGFSWVNADRAWNAIDSHIYGFTLQALKFPFQPEEYPEAAKGGLPFIPADQYPYMNALTIQVINREYDGICCFEFGLEMILEGLDRLLRSTIAS